VIDGKGQKVAVILPLKEYEHLQEYLHDLSLIADRKDENSISLKEMKRLL